MLWYLLSPAERYQSEICQCYPTITGMFCISNHKSPKSLFLWPLLSTHSHWISTFVGYESGIMACFNSISIRNYSLIAVRLVYATEHFPWFMIVLLFLTEFLVYQAVFVGGVFNTVIIFAIRIPWHNVLFTFKQWFVQEHIQAHSNDTIKVLHCWPYVLGMWKVCPYHYIIMITTERTYFDTTEITYVYPMTYILP